MVVSIPKKKRIKSLPIKPLGISNNPQPKQVELVVPVSILLIQASLFCD